MRHWDYPAAPPPNPLFHKRKEFKEYLFWPSPHLGKEGNLVLEFYMPKSDQLQKYMGQKCPLHTCACLWCDHSLVGSLSLIMLSLLVKHRSYSVLLDYIFVVSKLKLLCAMKVFESLVASVCISWFSFVIP